MADGPITLVELSSIDVDQFKGVGPKKVAALRAMGIGSMLDLILHYPRRYLDRTKQATIAEMAPGEEAMVLAKVTATSSRRIRGGRAMVVIDVSDGSGRLRATFFNQAWRERQLPVGTEAIFFGKVELFNGARQMTNPVVDLVGNRTGRIIAVYPQSEKAGVTSWELGDLASRALTRCEPRGLAEPLPADVLERYGLVGRSAAYDGIHRPESMGDTTAARKRLVFDELLRLQVALVQRKRELERTSVGIRHDLSTTLFDEYLRRLDFPLTAAQERTIAEIRTDLAAPAPMHRLLQGDVGSGKTVVAIATLLSAVQGGHQGALMAPTEVLAEQHLLSLRRDLADLTVKTRDGESLFADRELRIALLTNRISGSERAATLAGLASGEVDIAIGTHALIQESVSFHSLGAVVIDEQHRFGVEQRDALRSANADGTHPDVLVMTATPIPRTAAMTVYGDLDVSVLDELPPGRIPIVTSWIETLDGEDDMWRDVRAEIAEGRQVYVVCPLIDESEKLEVASATETFERLTAGELAGTRVALLHGRMTSNDKDTTMTAFRDGALDALVATTVIEVGVDVANATVMVILDPDRFGIAQLHQLRGRVGRASMSSRCYLVATEPTPDGRARLEAMVRTTDGFDLAEVDLDLRGEGTIMGERQKGRNDLRLASLRRDREWVEKARDVAFDMVGDGDGLDRYPMLRDEVRAFLVDEDEDYLLKS